MKGFPRSLVPLALLVLLLLSGIPAAGTPLEGAAGSETAPEAVQPAAGFWVRGQITYRDLTVEAGDCGRERFLPARQVQVEVWEEDGSILWFALDDYEWYTWTDDQGNFELFISNPYEYDDPRDSGGFSEKDIYIVVNAIAYDAGHVADMDREIYAIRSATQPADGGDLEFNLIAYTLGGIFNIADVLLDGYREFDPYYNPSPIRVYHQPGYGQDRTFYRWSEDWTGDVTRRIYIGDTNQNQGWNDGVILHEYGHYVADLYTCDDSPGGDHGLGGHYTPELTWSEGWAHYFSALTRGTPAYVKLNDDGTCWEGNWETWPIQGFDNEGAVAAIFWDIYDYSPSEDHDRMARGSYPIWGTLDEMGGGDCDIVGFYDTWYDLEPGYRRELAAIMGNYRTAYIWHRGEWSQEAPWPGAIYVVDTTQSMDDDIALVRYTILDLIDIFSALPEPYEFALETFGDGASTPVAHSFFVDVMDPAVEGLTVGGGGDPEENSLGALNQAAGRYGPLTYFLFTDAAPRDLEWGLQEGDGASTESSLQSVGGMGTLLSRLERKNVQVVVVFYGQCTDPNLGSTDAAAINSLEECLEPYQTVVDATNGSLLTVNSGSAGEQTDAVAAILRELVTDSASSGRYLHTVNSSSWDYVWHDVDYDWYDATGGTMHQIGDRQAVALPQAFSFYNAPYNTAYIGRPGYVAFADFASVSTNTGLPTTALPNRAIYGFWDNISNVINQGTEGPPRLPAIYTDYDAVNSRFVVEYHDNYHVESVPMVYENFEILLDLDTDEIIVQYAEVGDDSSVTIGVENAAGTLATEVAFDEPRFLYPGRAIRFTPVQVGPQEHEVLVDSTMSTVGFLLNTREGSTNLTLYRPDDTPVDPSDPDVTYLTAGGVEYYQVASPAAGTWTASVSGSGTYYFASSSDSSLIADFFGDTTMGMLDNSMVVDLGMNLLIQPSFSLVDPLGVVVDTLVLYDDGAHGDGEADDGVYGGTYSAAVAGTFTLMVEGQTNAGEPFRRFGSIPLTFQRSGFLNDPHSLQFAAPGDSNTYWFGFINGDVFSRTFSVQVHSEQGWSSSQSYTTTLGPGVILLQSVPYTIPPDAWGLVDDTVVSVSGEGQADSAAVTTIVRGPVYSITQWAYFPLIRPDGDRATIVALVEDQSGRPVVDGTEVTFQTSLGTIAPLTAATVDGTVTATLTSGAQTGFAHVSASVDDRTDVITVEIRPAPLASVTLSAADSHLPPDGTSTTQLTAHVYDEYNDPAPDGTTVLFVLNGDDGTMGTIEGGTIYTGTTSGGAATATFQSGTTQGRVSIRAVVWLSEGLAGEGEGTMGRVWDVTTIRLDDYAYDIFLPITCRGSAARR